MKCPQCSGSHRYKDGMTCRCGYRFVLDPKQDGYADGRLVAAFRRASCGGTCWFTRRQLATEIASMRSGTGVLFVFAVTFLGMSLFFAMQSDWTVVAVVMGLIGLALIWFGLRGPARLDLNKLYRAVEKYESGAEPNPFLLRDDRPLAQPPPDWNETDIYDYGAEGILILEYPLIVDLFVLNHFHTENRVVVVSECGYPDYIVPHVNQILSRQPFIPVYVLHDSTNHGMEMVTRLTESKIFHLRGHPVTDLGLQQTDPEQLPNLKKFASFGIVELDYLRWNKLSGAAAGAIAGGLTLAEVIDSDPASTGLSFG